MKRPTVGFVTCVHPFYELPAVVEARQRAIDELRQSGCEVVAAAIPRKTHDAMEIARCLGGARSTWRCFLLHLGGRGHHFGSGQGTRRTFHAAVGASVSRQRRADAFPYERADVFGLEYAADRRTLSASGGRRQPANVEKSARGESGGGGAGLRSARFGIIGGACPGMLDVEVDAADIQTALGATTVQMDLDTLLRAAKAAPAEEASRAAERLMSAARGERSIDEGRLTENLRLYAGLKEMVRQNKLDGYCVRCWPELRDERKITACAAHALLAEEGVSNTCEVDLTALITTWVLSRLAGAPAFNFDLTAYLEEEGAVQLAHCGAAAPRWRGMRKPSRFARTCAPEPGPRWNFRFHRER